MSNQSGSFLLEGTAHLLDLIDSKCSYLHPSEVATTCNFRKADDSSSRRPNADRLLEICGSVRQFGAAQSNR